MHFLATSFSSKKWKWSSRLGESSILAVFEIALVVFFEWWKSQDLQFYLHGSLVFKRFTRLQQFFVFFANLRKTLFFQWFLFFFALQEGSQGSPGSPPWSSMLPIWPQAVLGSLPEPQVDPKSTKKLNKNQLKCNKKQRFRMRHPQKTAVANLHCFVGLFLPKHQK